MERVRDLEGTIRQITVDQKSSPYPSKADFSIRPGRGVIIPSLSQIEADFSGKGLMQSGEEAEKGLRPWEDDDDDGEHGVKLLAELMAQIDWEISHEKFIVGIGASSCSNRRSSSPIKMAEEPDFLETWDMEKLSAEDMATIAEAVRSSSVACCRDLWASDASSLPDSEVGSPEEEQEGELEIGGVGSDTEDWDYSEKDHLVAQRRWTKARHARRLAREAEALKKGNSSGRQSQAQGGPRVEGSRAITQPNEQALEPHTGPLRHPGNRPTSSWAPTASDLAGGRRQLKGQPAISTSPNENTTHRPHHHGRPAIFGMVPTSPELAGALGDLRSVPIANGPSIPRFELPKVQLRKITPPGSTTPTTTPPAFNLPRVQLRPVFGRAEGRVNTGTTGSAVRHPFFCLAVH
jgi:hypothetical protein